MILVLNEREVKVFMARSMLTVSMAADSTK